MRLWFRRRSPIGPRPQNPQYQLDWARRVFEYYGLR